jgi:hypothetical protein
LAFGIFLLSGMELVQEWLVFDFTCDCPAERDHMAREVKLNTDAPDFELADYNGRRVYGRSMAGIPSNDEIPGILDQLAT